MKRIFVSLALISMLILPTTVFGSATLEYLRNNKVRLSIPVITYHLISKDNNKLSDFCISPKKLEDDFALLNAYGYKTLSVSELAEVYSMLNNPAILNNQVQVDNIINRYKHSVVLTSDDGYNSDYNYILPLMNKYSIKFNFFIVGSFINKPDYLTSEQIIQMSSNKLVQFGNHSNKLHNLSNSELQTMYSNANNSQIILDDFASANETLTKLTKKSPQSLSYPYGVNSVFIDNKLKNKGFNIRFTTNGGTALPFNGSTNIGRINRSNSLSPLDLIILLKYAK